MLSKREFHFNQTTQLKPQYNFPTYHLKQTTTISVHSYKENSCHYNNMNITLIESFVRSENNATIFECSITGAHARCSICEFRSRSSSVHYHVYKLFFY